MAVKEEDSEDLSRSLMEELTSFVVIVKVGQDLRPPEVREVGAGP